MCECEYGQTEMWWRTPCQRRYGGIIGARALERNMDTAIGIDDTSVDNIDKEATVA